MSTLSYYKKELFHLESNLKKVPLLRNMENMFLTVLGEIASLGNTILVMILETCKINDTLLQMFN